jgi:sterol desaturase/sphingolipid hydroxylase (fatty acid hydroxylase superfamily)
MLTEAWARLQALAAALVTTTSDRVAAPFLLGALLIAVGVWFRHVRGRQSLLRFLFPASIWWHRSARLDYALMVTRLILDAALLSSLSVSSQRVSFYCARALWRHVAILPDLHIPTPCVVAAFSLGAFIVDDGARYLVHRAFHRVPALWELHKLHHSAEVLTPFTIYRVDPIEGIANASAAALAVGVFGGALLWIAPGQLGAWTISGVYALSYLWNVAGTNLRHSQVWLSFGPTLERWLLSPAQHQIHHSADPSHHDRNFGSALALWDRIGGTLYVTGPREHLRFGLTPTDPSPYSTVIESLYQPLVAAGRMSMRARQRKTP